MCACLGMMVEQCQENNVLETLCNGISPVAMTAISGADTRILEGGGARHENQ